MSVSQISDLEADRYQLPDTRTLLKLGKALRCSIDEILGEADPDYSDMLLETAEAEHLIVELPEAVEGDRRSEIPFIKEGDAPPTEQLARAHRNQRRASRAKRASPRQPSDGPTSRRAYALLLQRDSMQPVFKPGVRLIVSVTDDVRDGDLVYVDLKSGERFIKIATSQSGGWLLSSINPLHGPLFVRDSEINSIHKVVFVHFLS